MEILALQTFGVDIDTKGFTSIPYWEGRSIYVSKQYTNLFSEKMVLLIPNYFSTSSITITPMNFSFDYNMFVISRNDYYKLKLKYDFIEKSMKLKHYS